MSSSSQPLRFSIPTRVFLAFAVVLVAFGGVATTSLLQHRRSAAALQLLDRGLLPVALSIGEARATQNVFVTLLDRVLEERDSSATRGWLTAGRLVRPNAIRRALRLLEAARVSAPEPGDRRVLDDVHRRLEDVLDRYTRGDAEFESLYRALVGPDRARAQQILTSVGRHEREIDKALREAWLVVQRRIEATSQAAEERERTSAEALAVVTVLALLIGGLLTAWSQRLLAPLPRLEERVAAVARGDLSRRFEPTKSDEIGRVATEFERMVDAVAARDTSLREAAEKLRALQTLQEQIVAGLRAAVVVVDAERVVQSANPSAASIGVGRNALGRPIDETQVLTRCEGLASAIEAVAHGADREQLSAATYVDEAGTRRLDVLVTPFGHAAPGSPRRSVLVVADDVTEELRTKERLIQSERLAAVGRMAAHVTHEVRNPLSSIGLNVEMLEDELATASAETKAILRALHREIDRLTDVTEEYLRLARLPQPVLEREDLGALVADAVKFVSPEMASRQCTLDLRVEPGLPEVSVDDAQVRQSLLNLLRNAREAMPEGGRIEVHVSRLVDGVGISVRDEGSGVAASDRERIFDPFFTTKERGTGLGLPLTQQIMAAHGGRVRCEPAEGRGTVFTLWFPLPVPRHAPEAAAE